MMHKEQTHLINFVWKPVSLCTHIYNGKNVVSDRVCIISWWDYKFGCPRQIYFSF